MFHRAATYQWEGMMDQTAEKLGYHLTGKMKDCIHCTRAKARQKKISKKTLNEDLREGTRIGMDVTGCRSKSIGGKLYVYLKIDYLMNMMFVLFLMTKDETVEDGLEFLSGIGGNGKQMPKYICWDRAGENKSM